MDNATETLTALLSTACQCEEDGVEFCNGCADWMKEGVLEVFREWLERNGDPQRVRCNGSAMTWQRLDGYAIAEATGKQSLEERLLDLLTLNGDFIIRYALRDNKLTAIRYSHDEPTGARFEFIAETEEATPCN